MPKKSKFSDEPTIGGRSVYSANNLEDLERRIEEFVELYPEIKELVATTERRFEEHLTAIKYDDPKYFAKVCIGQVLRLNREEILHNGTAIYSASPFFNSLNEIINSEISEELISNFQTIYKKPHKEPYEELYEDFHEEFFEEELRARMIIAESYHKGIGVVKDQKKSVKIFKELAGYPCGYSAAQCRLGALYFHGEDGFEENKEIAVELFSDAAAQGDPAAQYYLGFCHYKGIGGLERSEEEAIALWEESAKQGNAYAQFELGLCYEGGIGVEKNLTKAAELFGLAAENREFYDAQLKFAYCHYSGRGVEKDNTFAIWLFARVAEGSKDLRVFPSDLKIDESAENTKLSAHEIIDVVSSGIISAEPSLVGKLAKCSITPSGDGQPTLSNKGLREIKEALEKNLGESCVTNPSYLYVARTLADRERRSEAPSASAAAASAIRFDRRAEQQIPAQ